MLDRLRRHITILILLLLIPSVGKSQSAGQSDQPDQPRPLINVSTNLLYDVMFAPSIRVETGLGQRMSLSVSGTYGWNDGWLWNDKVRVLIADTEVRYWMNHQGAEVMRRGLYAGAYAALYRYDFLFGHKGQEAKVNWGVGLSCGYSLPVSSDFSFDFNIGLGYIGGKYKEYEPADDGSGHNIWMADKKRNYFGPTKAEIAFVWHIGKSKRVKK